MAATALVDVTRHIMKPTMPTTAARTIAAPTAPPVTARIKVRLSVEPENNTNRHYMQPISNDIHDDAYSFLPPFHKE